MNTQNDKSKRHKKESWKSNVWLLGLLGGVLAFAGSSMPYWGSPQQILSKWVPVIARDIGIALAIAALVALVLERLVHEALFEQIEDSHEALFKQIEESQDKLSAEIRAVNTKLTQEIHAAVNTLEKQSVILAGAREFGIEDIFARRPRKQGAHDAAMGKIRDAIQRQLSMEGEVRIACVAAPDFFRHGFEIGDLLWQEFTDNRCKSKLRVLVLNPNSDWATRRQELEPGHQVLPDINSAVLFLDQLSEKASGDKVRYLPSCDPPFAFLLITEQLAFVEAYPFAPVTVEEGPIGGKAPMLVFASNSEAYKRWSSHFDYSWERALAMKKSTEIKETEPIT